jgi:adenosylmethionine-8-amino-7-oxononanoate aminotransferase
MVAPPLIATENDVHKILKKLDQALRRTESKLREKFR